MSQPEDDPPMVEWCISYRNAKGNHVWDETIIAAMWRIDSEDYILMDSKKEFVWAAPRESVRSIKRKAQSNNGQ